MQEVRFADKTINMKRFIYFWFLIILSNAYSFISAEEVFAPFVSRLTATPDENTIKLTWVDSKDTIKSYFIYRYTEKISDLNFSKSEKVGEITPGKEIFIDIPGKTEPYYYAVLASDSGNTLYKLFIPYRNITVKPVQIKSAASPEELSTHITNIETTALEKEIKIIFKSSKPDRKVVIYRSTSPLQRYEDLANAIIIATIPSAMESYNDTPVPGVSYYYAVFDSELTKSGKYDFNIGENITSNSTELSLVLNNKSFILKSRIFRSQPLPYLNLKIGIESGQPLSGKKYTFPRYKELSSESEKIIYGLTVNMEKYIPDEPTPYIFPIDKETRENSESYQLVRILKTDFTSNNWSEASRLLADFLNLRHTKDIEMRTHFYMGQVLYYLEKYKDSFMEFSLVEDRYYKETRPWLDSLFYLLDTERL